MPMMGNIGCNDSVWCFTYFNGSLYIGGSFTQAGGIPCNHIARWDGTSWYAVGNGFNAPVHSLCVYNNQLFAGGNFTMSGSTSVSHLGYWDGSQWMQVDGGTNGNVWSLLVWDGDLYIGGDFTRTGSVTVNHIFKWDGTTISALAEGMSSWWGACSVYSMCVYNGNLYCGGIFNNCGGNGMRNLGMWNGSYWTSIGDIGNGMMSDMVGALCVYNDQLFVGGYFSSCGMGSANNLGTWNGSTWSNIGTGMNGIVRSLAVYNNSLYIAGSFTSATGVPVNNIAKYSSITGMQSLTPETLSLEVYPNPCSGDFISVSWNDLNLSAVTITISDVSGRTLSEHYSGTLTAGINNQNISVSDLNNGVYFLTLYSNNTKSAMKFSITK